MGGVPWTEEEDHLLKKCIEQFGEGKWHRVPLLAGLNRCRKSCRLRWLNYLRPNIKRGSFTQEEVDLIIKLHKLLGNRWSLIAGRLPGRTANDVKNYWNCHLSKKLTAEQISNEQEENTDDRNMPIFRPLPQNLGTVSLIPIRREQEAPMPQPNPPPSEVGTSMPFLCAEDGAEQVVQDEHKQSLPIEEHAVVLEDLPIDFEFDDVRIDGINNNRKWDWDDLFHGHGPLE